jgi:hypothetical protein
MNNSRKKNLHFFFEIGRVGMYDISVLPPLTTITLECFQSRADNTLHCKQLSSDIVKLKEVGLPHQFYHVSGLLLKNFSMLAHALGSGIDSKNNKSPYTAISFSLYV